jgi:transcriptional repressor NrdR
MQQASLFVIKKDKRREEFNKEKLLSGLRKACEKRPLPTGTIDKLADEIESQLYNMGRSEVSSIIIGDVVMEGLRRLDHIAYIRFASVYRDFSDIDILKEAVDTLVKGGVKPSHLSSQLSLIPTEGLPVTGKVHKGTGND